jgi:hypothetical protein
MFLVQVSLLFGDPAEQKKPTYILQSLEQPSPLTLLPSSQARVNLLPSPQIYRQSEEEKSR